MQLSPGDRLDDRYEILRLLGAGGMGEVYQARDLRLGREVAIKVLPEHLAAEAEALKRFEWEARILAALSHPNIRALHDLGHEEGFHFAVMEYLEGETLRRRMEDGPLPAPEALKVAESLAEGLAAAHAKGVIHRDLKPENVFFTADGQLKILDFGLARLAPGQGPGHLQSDRMLETQPGLVMGTVGYMAPEQVRGQALDARCDLFAFGCLLFEMLMNQRPFEGETVPEVLAAILKDPAPPVAGPPELRRFVAACLEKDLFRRVAGAREAAITIRELRALYPASGSVAHPTAPLPRISAPQDISTEALAVTVTARDLASSSLPKERGLLRRLADLWPFRSKTIDAIAVLPFEHSSRDVEMAYLAEGLAEGLIERLALVPGLRVAPWSAVFRLRASEVDFQELGRRLRVQAILTGRVAHRGTELSVSAELLEVRTLSHLWGEQYQRAFSALMEVQQELCTRIAARLRMRVSGEVQRQMIAAPTEDSEAFRLYLKGRHAWRMRGADALQRAVEAFQEALERDPGFALAYAGLADAYTLLSFLVGVIAPMDAMPKARAAAQKALELRPDLAEAHASMGMILESFEWDWAGAEREHLRALELGPDNPNLHHRYGMHLLYRRRFDEAARRFQEALRLDPLSPLIQVAQGLPAHFGGRPADAIPAFRQTIALTPQFLIGHLMLGLALEQDGQSEEAIASFSRARDIAETPDGLAMLGHALACVGRVEEAEAILARLKELSATRYVNDYGRALIRLALGDRDRALLGLERAADRRCELLVYLAIDPRVDMLRQEPRFQTLVKRVGLAG
ncbi:MAG TPA: protein kinase [Holophagaceae bacterium]|nr:protein kinase [Holophagaceae bacterium]